MVLLIFECSFDGVDQAGELLLVEAHRRGDHLAVGAHEEVARDVVGGVAVVGLARGVEGHGKGVARLLAERFDRGALLAARDGQEDEVAAGEAVDELPLHVGELLAAGRAPRGPEVDQHHLAAQRRERDAAAVDHLDGEVGCLVALSHEGRGLDVVPGLPLRAAAARGEQQDRRRHGDDERQEDE